MPGSAACAVGRHRHFIRLSFAEQPSTLELAVERLAAAWELHAEPWRPALPAAEQSDAAGQRTAHSFGIVLFVPAVFHGVTPDRLSPITPDRIRAIEASFTVETASPRKIMPTAAAPAAPIPVHTA